MIREIVLDTETTGLDPATGDRIVEIGAVELLNHIPTGRTYHQYINPERDVPLEAFNVHGLSAEFLADYPVFAAISDGFLEFIDDAILIIHNAPFDMKFINAELSWLKRPVLPMERVIDSLALARKRHPMGPNSLDALCRRYGIDNSKREKHGALLDSELLADVYIELIGGRQTTFSLTEVREETRIVKQSTTRTSARVRSEPLPSRLTEAEIRHHEEMVAKLGERALWASLQKN